MSVRLLVVSDRLPPAARSGAGSVLLELLEQLGARHQVERLTLAAGGGALARSQSEIAIRRALGKAPDAVLTLGPSVTASVPVYALRDGALQDRSVGQGVLGGLRRRVRASRSRAGVGIVPTEPSRALLCIDGEARVLPPGIDADHWTPRASRPEGPIRLLFLGRLVPTRGAHAALEAVLGLPSWALKAIALDIVGAAEDPEYLAGIRRRAAGAPVRFFPDAVDVLPHLRSADLAVLPSTAEDGWGRAILEAMACGVPVVHSKGGVLDVVTGGAGVGVAAGNLKPLGETLRALLRKPEALPAQGAKGREHILAHHAWPVVLPRWEALLTGR